MYQRQEQVVSSAPSAPRLLHWYGRHYLEDPNPSERVYDIVCKTVLVRGGEREREGGREGRREGGREGGRVSWDGRTVGRANRTDSRGPT